VLAHLTLQTGHAKPERADRADGKTGLWNRLTTSIEPAALSVIVTYLTAPRS